MKCPTKGRIGVCTECQEWTSLCTPCCSSGVAREPGGGTSNDCACGYGDPDDAPGGWDHDAGNKSKEVA